MIASDPISPKQVIGLIGDDAQGMATSAPGMKNERSCSPPGTAPAK
jgi:hypothetical protein